MMQTKAFDFDLPKDRIAQHPSDRRDDARLMVLDRAHETIEHRHFYEIADLLTPNDVLVINDTKVIPARLMGIKQKTGAVIEVLLLKQVEKDVWEAMTQPARRVNIGTEIIFSDRLAAECVAVKAEGLRHFKMHYQGIFLEILDQLGTMPLPPYITEKLFDQDRYQTVYARDPGSAAAPTAGLHFTEALLDKIRNKGIEIIPITLSVGLGTFKPVSAADIKDHVMHKETYTISTGNAKRLNQAVKQKKSIVCVGTTSMRTLESNYQDGFHPGTFETDIFIYPGYPFKVVNQLITNFHLPKSTLIMLVSAFASTNLIKSAYQMAIEMRYRFFSFGDAMLIK